MLERLSKMSTRQAIIEIQGKPSFGEVPRCLDKICERFGLSYRTARSLWNNEIKNENHWAVQTVIQEANRVKREAEQAKVTKARESAAALADHYFSIAGGLLVKDADFHRFDIVTLVNAARIISSMDRTGNKGDEE